MRNLRLGTEGWWVEHVIKEVRKKARGLEGLATGNMGDWLVAVVT